MFYVDTSVLAAYYCPEPLSDQVEDYMTSHDRPTISSLTEVEMCSAISRKVREGGMNRKDADRILANFLSHIEEGFYVKIPIESQYYSLAREWIRQFNTSLRTLDALHLATAFSKRLPIITADELLSKSATVLGVDVVFL